MTQREKLQNYIDETKVPRKRVAAGLGISETTLSQYLAGKYPGDNSKIDEAVVGYLERFAEKAEKAKTGPVIGFAKTKQARRCWDVLRACHIDGDMGLVVSSAGLGKTTAIRQYAQENKDVILLTARPTVNIKVLLVEMANLLKVHSGGINDQLARAVAKMLTKSGRMIVVDEAQFLPTICLETFRYLHDEAGVGLVYAGMPALYQNLSRQEHIFSRIGAQTQLPPLEEDDIRAILDSTEIPVSDAVVKAATTLAEGSGRRLIKLFRHACRLVNGREVTAQAMAAAQKQMLVA